MFFGLKYSPFSKLYKTEQFPGDQPIFFKNQKNYFFTFEKNDHLIIWNLFPGLHPHLDTLLDALRHACSLENNKNTFHPLKYK